MNRISKWFFIYILAITSLCSCNSIKYGELFEITDEFVNDLQSTYQSYGMFGGMEHTKYTKDKECFSSKMFGKL